MHLLGLARQAVLLFQGGVQVRAMRAWREHCHSVARHRTQRVLHMWQSNILPTAFHQFRHRCREQRRVRVLLQKVGARLAEVRQLDAMRVWRSRAQQQRQCRMQGPHETYRRYCLAAGLPATRSMVSKLQELQLGAESISFRHQCLGCKGSQATIRALDLWMMGAKPGPRSLDLSGNGIGDATVLSLVDLLRSGSHWARLHLLDLRDNAISARGAAALLDLASALRCLVDVPLEGNPIGDTAVRLCLQRLSQANGDAKHIHNNPHNSL